MKLVTAYSLAASSVFALCLGQLLFKYASLHMASLYELLRSRTALGALLLALTIYALSTVMWLLALRELPLSRAYLLMSFGFVLVPVGAHFVFGEPLTWRMAGAVVLVVAGIALANT